MRNSLNTSRPRPWAVLLDPARRPSVNCKQPCMDCMRHIKILRKSAISHMTFTSPVFRPILVWFSCGFHWRYPLIAADKAIKKCWCLTTSDGWKIRSKKNHFRFSGSGGCFSGITGYFRKCHFRPEPETEPNFGTALLLNVSFLQ